jgi:hypothetical protein
MTCDPAFIHVSVGVTLNQLITSKFQAHESQMSPRVSFNIQRQTFEENFENNAQNWNVIAWCISAINMDIV